LGFIVSNITNKSESVQLFLSSVHNGIKLPYLLHTQEITSLNWLL